MFAINAISSTPPIDKESLEQLMKMPYPSPKNLSFGLSLLDPKYRLSDDFDAAVLRMAEDKCSKTYVSRQGAHLESVANEVIRMNSCLKILDDPMLGADTSFVRGRQIFVVDFKNSFSTVNDSSARGCYEKLMKTAAHFHKSHRKPIIPAILTSIELNRSSYQSHYGLNFVNTRDTMTIIGNNPNFYNVWISALSKMPSPTDEYNAVVESVAKRISGRLSPFRTRTGFNHALAIQQGM